MTRTRAAIVLSIALATATGAFAEDGGKVPIQRDLRQWDRVEQRTESTGALRPGSSVTPTNPSGVPGFSGGPGVIGDSVNSYSPLPPGAPGNETW